MFLHLHVLAARHVQRAHGTTREPRPENYECSESIVFVDDTQIMLVAQDSRFMTLRPAEHQVPGGCARFPAQSTTQEHQRK